MIQRDFWHSSRIAVIGGGSWGTVLANLIAENVMDVRLWTRSELQAREINSTRNNPQYFPELKLNEKIHALSGIERVFEDGIQALIWALPSDVTREQAKALARHFKGDEILLHATKGIEQGSLKRVSEILREEIPCPRIGVISGPNLAREIAQGQSAATVVASSFDEVVEAGRALLGSERFRVYGARDVIGVEWAGTLKNILAIASGALDALKMGWNARAMLITLGLAEMVRFGVAMGAREATFLGLAGIGDLLATCSSPLSRNYRVGFRIASGESLATVLEDLGGAAEGVHTTHSVSSFALSHSISMPITEAVERMISGSLSPAEAMNSLMNQG